jgi:hypothetical protein
MEEGGFMLKAAATVAGKLRTSVRVPGQPTKELHIPVDLSLIDRSCAVINSWFAFKLSGLY